MRISSFIRRLFTKPKAYVLTQQEMIRIAKEAKEKGIKYLPLHYVGVANADTSGEAITNYHKKILGWKADGYHFFLNHDGILEELEPLGTRVNGCLASGKRWWKPWSKYPSNEEYIGVKSLHMCFETINGYKMSPTQEKIFIALFKELIRQIPGILIGGHREFPDYENWNKRQNTICPGFSVSDWLMANGIPKANCFYEVWKP